MKVFVACTLFILGSLNCSAQFHFKLKDILPDKEFENILVKALSSDSLSSSFIIWIKDTVKAHKHLIPIKVYKGVKNSVRNFILRKAKSAVIASLRGAFLTHHKIKFIRRYASL